MMHNSVEVKNGKNRFRTDVLENNWNEERWDYKYLREQKPLNFVTTKFQTNAIIIYFDIINCFFFYLFKIN